MSSSDLIHDARVTAVAGLAHLAQKHVDDANSVLRFFLLDKVDEGYAVPQILDSLVKATMAVAVMIAEDDPEVFGRIAVGMALETS